MEDRVNIQWYPGHMTKTRRQLEQDLKQVDAVCELLDARIPHSSRNPDIDSLCAGKPRIVVLNRMDLADPAATKHWAEYFRAAGAAVICADCKSRRGLEGFSSAVQEACAEKLARDSARGMNRPLRIMIVGIPNVGKSTLINQIAGRRGAKAENRPGVTRGKQWVTVDPSLLLLDTPGILWPRFEDVHVGLMLGFTGAVKENVLDLEDLAARLMVLLNERYPDALAARYDIACPGDTPGWELLELVGRRRGYLIARGEVDLTRAARNILDEFRSGRLGRFTLEVPNG